MFDKLKNDIRVVLERDPAARNAFEVFLCYPGFHAVRTHRRTHWLHTHHCKLLARILSQLSRFFTGIEIHPGATIGKGLFIDHGMGVVIGETTIIGNNVTLYQGVTLGGTGKETGKRHPTLGNNVMVASGAKVLGPFKVGDHSKIGAGAVVLKEVPPGSTVIGVPGRVVNRSPMRPSGVICEDMNCKPVRDGLPECMISGTCPAEPDFTPPAPVLGDNGVDLDQVHLPDPVAIELQLLRARITRLEDKLDQLTKE
jgi:serine O-acetyltransferase